MNNNLDIINELMDKYNKSFYLYDEKIISRQIDLLKGNFPNFEILYSVKTNPFKPILDFIQKNNLGADAASAEEVNIAYSSGISKEKILYSTPGKTREDIFDTIYKSIIVADSYNELALINEIAKENNLHIKVGLRINPNFSMESNIGTSSVFGVDEETLYEHNIFLDKLKDIEIIGIHVHIKSQILDYIKLYNYYKNIFKLAEYCIDELNWKLEFINFGGGLGIQYSQKKDEPLDINKLGIRLEELAKKFKDKFNIRLIIESGRYIICEAGQYISPIVDIKESRGTKYLIIEKGLNGFLRPSIARLLDSYAFKGLDLNPSEPLFTSRDAFEFFIINGDEKNTEIVSITGSLCTATDIMAKDIVLPKASIGNIIVVSKAGSYSYSLSPLLFASHSLPRQIFLKEDGKFLTD